MGGGARRAVEQERPRAVVSCGFSGGLDPALAPGDLVLATSVRTEEGDVLPAPDPLRRAAAAALGDLRCSHGELLCATAVAATPDEKRALAKTSAIAVDMESYPAARAAAVRA
jgi:nucleoside phosphorylase